MQDSDLYIDSEEDEVFFGRINDREKVISYNATKHSVKISAGRMENNSIKVSDSQISDTRLNNSIGNEEFHSFNSSNASVELEHGNSCMKQIIDKNILSTPKSIVKADKDGGFLKVLSEIALVKAENDELEELIMQEEKENKFFIPEIRLIEATPEKRSVSPVSVTQSRRFRTIYDSSKKAENFDFKQNVKSNSFTETSKSKNCTRTFQNGRENMCNSDIEKAKNVSQTEERIRGNSWPDSVEVCQESVIQKKIKYPSDGSIETCKGKNDSHDKQEVNVLETDKSEEKSENEKDVPANTESSSVVESENLNLNLNEIESNESKKIDEIIKDKVDSIFSGVSEFEKSDVMSVTKEENDIDLLTSESKIVIAEEGEANDSLKEGKTNDQIEDDLLQNLSGIEALKIDLDKSDSAEAESNPTQCCKETKLPSSYRFSKEARKIVDAIKKSTADESLNFTIPEINLEEMENTFTSPKHLSILDETMTVNEKIELHSEIQTPTRNILTCVTSKQWKSVEVNCSKQIFFLSEKKGQASKFVSDKKIMQTGIARQVKKCAKKLPINEKTPIAKKISDSRSGGQQTTEKKSGTVLTSRIPISNSKTLKPPSNCRIAHPTAMKSITFKTPSGKTIKNSKFKNVASPISAYIHNKPTTLIANVKPSVKKDCLMSIQKNQLKENSKKEETKRKDVGLPFVKYRSATPYKLEKHPDSRLPRLAPTVQKLIGLDSPKILKHKGRFFVMSPSAKGGRGGEGVGDATISSDSNEVSVLISQVAQKSNTMK